MYANDESLDMLKAGHRRFITGSQRSTKQMLEGALAVSGRQQPFAAVVSCADSRTSPELIFDAGFGELFTVRSAGALVSRYDIAALEFAALELDVRLILIMGHTSCGAVSAAVSGSRAPTPHLQHLFNAVRPVEQQMPAGCRADEVTAELIRQTLRELPASSQKIARLHERGELLLEGCLYDIASGQLEWIAPEPLT